MVLFETNRSIADVRLPQSTDNLESGESELTDQSQLRRYSFKVFLSTALKSKKEKGLVITLGTETFIVAVMML